MLQVQAFLTNLFLIAIIFLKIPNESMGLVSFGTKNNLLGSPSSAQRFLNIATIIGILIYFLNALILNLFKD